MKKVFGIFFYFFLLRSSVVFSSVPPDSVGYMYPLWDERNPDCSCHRLEKEAQKVLAGQTDKKNDLVLAEQVRGIVVIAHTATNKIAVKKRRMNSWKRQRAKSTKRKRGRTGRIDSCFR
jgi:hypothetical protein